MNRRDFAKAAVAAGAATSLTNSVASATEPSPAHKFHLKYAPHFGMFKAIAGNDLLDQLRFGFDQGFTAWEDNGMKGRSIQEQEAIAKTMDQRGMEMGVFVGSATNWSKPGMTTGSKDFTEQFLKEIRESIEVAKRVRARWMTIVPGRVDLGQQMDYQTSHVIENLRRAAELLEPHDLVMVLEPLNWWANHPGLFLERIPQAYQICTAVDSSSCKILFDIYHQQISEGNIIPNIDKAWDEIGYFQIGDNPGRKEPGTGEINYRNVFKHIYDKGYTGIMGMEHGNSLPGKEGEQAVIDAYVAADNFEV